MIENKKDNQLGIKSAVDIIGERLSPEAENILTRLGNQEKLIKYKWLCFKAYGSITFDFRDYRYLKELFRAIYHRHISIEDAERDKNEFEGTLNALERYDPRKPDYKTARDSLLINAKNLYDGRKVIIDAFKNKIFPSGVEDPEDLGKRPDESDESYAPRELETIPELPDSESEEETPTDMLELESEESAEQRRKPKGQGLKILTPQQILTRLPISLAQLKSGNNSEKLKKEIRQLLNSLYRLKS